MKKYFIKVTGKTFYEIFPIKAENLFFAKIMAFNNFIKNYPCEKRAVSLQQVSANGKII